MKVTYHTPTTPRFSTKNEQKEHKNIQENKKTAQEDSITIANNNQKLPIKEINQAIGALQVTNKALQKLSIDAQNLIENNDDSAIKKSIQNTLNQSNFNGSNVFDEDYTDLSIKTNFAQLKRQAKSLDNPADIKKFAQEVEVQHNQAKQAISILQNRVNNAFENDKRDYENLDTALLSSTNFKNAHNLEALSPNRVSKLLA